ncbi:MAG TPA: hypothetical protein VMW49_06410 [Candidatus Dormibacteraeota bacterium]|nr:hypothetical protein [Candidatus Dormibacteraeota bacterium]
MATVRRPAILVVLVVAFLAVVGGIYTGRIVQATAHATGWALTQNVTPGTQLTAADVKAIQIATSGDPFNFVTASPLGDRVTTALSAGDLLTASVLGPSGMAEVSIPVQSSPALTGGDLVDIYADDNGNLVLIARRITVVATGNTVTILVPNTVEPLWLAVATSSVPLVLAISSGIGVPDYPTLSGTGALQALAAMVRQNRASGPVTTAPPRARQGGGTSRARGG